MRPYRDKLLITGEDRFLGYSFTMGARAALIGMAAALTDLQAELIRAFREDNFGLFVRLSGILDRFSLATFKDPMEGYIRRMLWAAASQGIIPEDVCDDPWGPVLDPAERETVRQAVMDARAARA
jgi:4-hydroxy-tetrahydrodipicolinate synthase